MSRRICGAGDRDRQLRGQIFESGGGRGIRTPGTLSGTVVFKTTAIDHSAIPPLAHFIRKPAGSEISGNGVQRRIVRVLSVLCLTGGLGDRSDVPPGRLLLDILSEL